MIKQKRVAAIHDISCFGKCSLTVALPILSAAGIECTVLPTAVLSTHTGGIEGYTFRDLTEDMLPIAEHWASLGIRFDSIYTGFLGSAAQIELVKTIFDKIGNEDTLIAVDPVMGDNGKLYGLFDASFPAGMRSLCERADLIVPNLTEAALMLEEPYVEGPYTEEYIHGMLKKLAALGPRRVVLTGVCFDEKTLGAAGYSADENRFDAAFSERIPGYYHGTGDVFASALLSALMCDMSMDAALRVSVDFTVNSIARTRAAGSDIRFGVNFEAGLGALADAVSAQDAEK